MVATAARSGKLSLAGSHPHGWQVQPWQRTLEGTILSLGGTEAVMFARVPSGRIWELRSADDGRTWSDPEPTVLRHPDAPPMVFWLGDGSTMAALIHNQGAGDWRGQADRRELWASLSRDAGRSWSEPRLLMADSTLPRAAPSTRDAALIGFDSGRMMRHRIVISLAPSI